jgi:hypothetical protein
MLSRLCLILSTICFTLAALTIEVNTALATNENGCAVMQPPYCQAGTCQAGNCVSSNNEPTTLCCCATMPGGCLAGNWP